MKKWLLIGLMIRLVLMVTTYHSDSHFFVLMNYLLGVRGEWAGVYDFLGSGREPLTGVLPPYAVTYPPLALLVPGVWAILTYGLLDHNFIEAFLLDPGNMWHHPYLALVLLCTKLPYLIPDLATGWLLTKLMPGKKELMWKLWMLNPVVMYASYAMGQFDIYPTFLTVAAVYTSAFSPVGGAVLLGLGGAFKMFPLLLLPAYTLLLGRTWGSRVMILVSGITAYVVCLLPYIGSHGFRTYALLAPQTEKMLFAKIPVTGAEFLSLFVVGYVIIIAACGLWRVRVWAAFGAVLLLFLAVTHFHPQWFIWLMPVLLLFYVEYVSWRWVVMGLMGLYFLLVLSFDNSLHIGLFAYSIPALRDLQEWRSLLPAAVQINLYISMIRSAFAGLATMTGVLMWKGSRYETS